MKVCIAFALLLLLINFGCSQSNKVIRVHGSEITLNNSGLRTYDAKLFTGQVVTYYPNGQLASLDEFADGRRHGIAQKWFRDGVLSFESNYRKGVREGYTQSWWYNGNIRSSTFFEAGKAQGEAWSWYRNGNKFKRYNFVDGQPSGIQQAWRLNGKLFSNFEYKNGRIFGLRKSNTCVGLEDENISLDYYRNQAGDS
ncbi:toxin-antitoxin system YwqK family antitoxin [Alteromonas sp. KUL49]|uniref:toxin-antitoxin system YwqK family antitoxin n=1 Tax=Alteromonas sp. KUL49 TaxID=2480798 RepID=UPI0010FFC600|nr:toxin-antitoxin system YwqK family antitoxin [Alteromonas sp. KUL49]GEA09823.1 hypothetical protein KUL49_01980 [Alteromonas sp. KUL49]